MIKTCNRCGKDKPLSEYNKRSDRPCGLQSICRQCQKKRWAEWVNSPEGEAHQTAKNADPAEKARKLAYSRTPEGKERLKAYRQTPAGKEARKRDMAKRLATEEGRYKHAVRGALNDAVRYHKIKKAKICSRCGKPCVTQGHHRSYKWKNRLQVEWLCAQCHANEHGA